MDWKYKKEITLKDNLRKLQFYTYSYAGIIRIRFMGRNAQFPLSLFESSPYIQFRTVYYEILCLSIGELMVD